MSWSRGRSEARSRIRSGRRSWSRSKIREKYSRTRAEQKIGLQDQEKRSIEEQDQEQSRV